MSVGKLSKNTEHSNSVPPIIVKSGAGAIIAAILGGGAMLGNTYYDHWLEGQRTSSSETISQDNSDELTPSKLVNLPITNEQRPKVSSAETPAPSIEQPETPEVIAVEPDIVVSSETSSLNTDNPKLDLNSFPRDNIVTLHIEAKDLSRIELCGDQYTVDILKRGYFPSGIVVLRRPDASNENVRVAADWESLTSHCRIRVSEIMRRPSIYAKLEIENAKP